MEVQATDKNKTNNNSITTIITDNSVSRSLLFIRYCVKFFTQIISFSAHSNPKYY